MNVRGWIASVVCPAMAREAALWRFAQQQYGVAHRWLAEFPDACDTLEWVFIGTVDFFRDLDDAAVCTMPARIDDFREFMRRRKLLAAGAPH